MHEVIDPSREDIKTLFGDAFKGMTDEIVTLDELADARERLIAVGKRREQLERLEEKLGL